MKTKTIIISLLLFLLIIGATVGKTYITTGLYAVGTLIVLLCLVFYIFKLLLNEKKSIEESFQNLKTNLDSAKTEILLNQAAYKEQIMSDITEKHFSLNQIITQGIDSLKNETINRTNTVVDLLSAQSENIDDKFKMEAELIDSLSVKNQSLSSEILNKITSGSAKTEDVLNKTAEHIWEEEERTRKIIEDASNKISSLLDSQREVFKNSIDASNDSITKISHENKDAVLASVSELSIKETSSREALLLSLSDVLQKKSHEIKDLIESSHETVANDINNRGIEMTDNITRCIVNSIGVVSDNINKTYTSLTESTDSLLQTFKAQSENINNNVLSSIERNDALKEIVTSDITKLEDILNVAKLQVDNIIRNVESVKQQNNTIEESIITNNKLIENSENAVVTSVNQHKTEIVDIVLQNTTNISTSIEQSVSKALTTLTESIRQANTLNIKTEETLLQSNNDQTQLISSAIHKIEECVIKTLKSNNDNAELLSESLVEMTNSISSKIESMDKQNQTLKTDIKELNSFHNGEANTLRSISDQFNSLQNGITSIQIQSNNVENLVNEFTKKNSNIAIIDSLKSMIAELRQELKSGVSDLNDEILETQINQETINDEIDKLQVLLRNISKESKGVQEQSTHTSTTTSKTDLVSRTSPQKQPEVKRTPPIIPSANFSELTNVEPNPNRTETIIDKETNNIVINQFVRGQLAKSTMKDHKGHIIFELEYKDGKIVRSKNYDTKGIINIEQTYYENGQVHFRNEKTIKGNISTEFDKNGNKK